MIHTLFCLVCAAPQGLAAGAPSPPSEPLNMYALEQRIAPRLEEDGAAALLTELEPSGEEEARFLRFVLLVRADRGPEAQEALDLLSPAPWHVLDDLGDWLIGRGRDGLARQLLEARPELRLGRTSVLLQRMVEERGLDATVAWVRAREQGAPLTWWSEHARLLASNRGDLESYFAVLEDEVRGTPEDMERAVALVEVVQLFGPKHSLSWMADEIRTAGPVEDLRLARSLAGKHPNAAATILLRAENRPITESVLASVRIERLDALKKASRLDEAQELLEELVENGDVDVSTGLPTGVPLSLAGQVQHATGASVVQGRVRTAEPIGEDDPRYWFGRADYFRGRNELDESRAALERVLEQTDVESAKPELEARRESDRRSALRGLLGLHLSGGGDPSTGVALLLRELERLADQGRFSGDGVLMRGFAHSLVHDLAYHSRLQLDPGEPVLWRFLAAVPELDYTSERLIRRLGERVPAVDRDAFWGRCLALPCAEAAPSREMLGFAMIVIGEQRRAIPFLERALQELPPGPHRERCADLLVRAGIETGDWRVAREAWTEGRARLGVDERLSRLHAMAELAAESGALDDAIDLWRRHVMIDTGDVRGLEALARAGLEAQLIEFYESLAESDPKSAGAARALAILRD